MDTPDNALADLAAALAPGGMPDWTGAVCAQTDPELFFPEKGGGTRAAKRLCGGCPVREACLQYALDQDERFGVWGGLSEQERRRLSRGEAAALKPRTPVLSETTLHRRATVARLTAAGLSVAEIAAELGCHRRAVARHRAALRDAA